MSNIDVTLSACPHEVLISKCDALHMSNRCQLRPQAHAYECMHVSYFPRAEGIPSVGYWIYGYIYTCIGTYIYIWLHAIYARFYSFVL